MVFIASPIELPRFTSIHIGRANHTEEYVDLLMIVIGAPTTNKKELSSALSTLLNVLNRSEREVSAVLSILLSKKI